MITVIFATYNGERTLRETLDSMCELRPPKEGWRLIVVDNGSTDRSLAILRSYEKRLPLSILCQPKRGKNACLNLALSHTSDELIVFTDDDVIVDPDWLIFLANAAANYVEIDVFGGAILPHWPDRPAEWILKDAPLDIAYGLTPLNKISAPAHPNEIWGANMMIRNKIFMLGNRFNEDVGPTVGSYAMGSETEFIKRLYKQGHQLFHVAEALVKHQIRSYQLKRSWLLTRAVRAGRGSFAAEQRNVHVEINILGVPRWAIRKFISHAIKALVLGAPFNTIKSFRETWKMYFFAGYILHAYGTYRSLNLSKRLN